jgi:hypothetical protein
VMATNENYFNVEETLRVSCETDIMHICLHLVTYVHTYMCADVLQVGCSYPQEAQAARARLRSSL